MATLNPFDLLDDDAEDPSLLLAAQQKAVAALVSSAAAQPKKAQAKARSQPATEAKFPSKPTPPAQAVKDFKNEVLPGGRGEARGRGGARGRGFKREPVETSDSYGVTKGYLGGHTRPSNGDIDRRTYSGPRDSHRGGYSNGEDGQRMYERRSGTGRGNDIKREGAGRGNWGTPSDDIVPVTEELATEVKDVNTGNEPVQDDAGDANKDSSTNEPEVVKPEEQEMTLEEYEKVLEEKRKTLLALKAEERKVNLDKELEAMQPLANKKNDDDVFIKLGSDKDKRKEAAEKAKKSVSINEFLKPANGENFYRGGGRGRGRGRGRDGHVSSNHSSQAPAIEDVGQFPSLGGK